MSTAVPEGRAGGPGRVVPDGARPGQVAVGVRRVGFWSAASAAVLSATWTVAAVLTGLGSPVGAWPGIDAYAASFESRQLLMLVPAFLLAPTFVVLMACLHAHAAQDRKPWGLLGLVFAAIYAAVAGADYFLQLTVVRQHLLSRQTDGLSLLVGANPGSVMWALEVFGYDFMSLAMLVAAPVFAGAGLERWIRWLFLANGLLLASGAVYVYTLDPLHPLVLAVLPVWCVTFPTATGLLAALFRRAERAATAGERDPVPADKRPFGGLRARSTAPGRRPSVPGSGFGRAR